MSIPSVTDNSIHAALDTLTEQSPTTTDSSVSNTDGAAAPQISSKRADAIIDWLRSYASERLNSQLIDERRCIPPYVVLDFGNRGILGMQVEEKSGGTALGNRDAMRVVEQLAAIDLTLATFVVNNEFLGIRPIQRYATQAVRDQLLPILANGRELAAFALTEPSAGSNPQALCSTGVVDASGGWRLSGTKVWSGSAAWAGVINVFVKLVDANNNSSGITGFAVRQGTPGMRPGPESLTMGMRGMVQNFVYLDDVPVSEANLLGVVGSGMETAKDAMLYTRLAIGAMSVGGLKRCAQLMLRYATRREVSTGRLLDNPVTLARLSNLTAATTAFETLVARIAELLDTGYFVPQEGYIACKTSGPELLAQAADNLVQLLGGRGYTETNIAAQILRDARVFRIFEGPTETLNMFLGSRVIHSSTELQQFLGTGLGAETVWDSLKDAAIQIQARWSEPSSPFSDRPSALRWTSILIGEVATSAIVLAAVEGAYLRTPSHQLRRAVDWARSQFDVTLERALSVTPLESVLLSANETTALISSYAEAIGDLEQTLAGVDVVLSDLLRRQATAATTPNGIAILPDVATQVKSIEPDASSSHQIALPSPVTVTNLPEVTPVKSSQPDSGHSHHTTESIETWIAEWLADELGINVDAIDKRESFVYYGLDSVTTVRLADGLEVWLKRQLSPTLAWDYPSISSLARYLAGEAKVVPAANRTIPAPFKADVNQWTEDEEMEKLLAEIEEL